MAPNFVFDLTFNIQWQRPKIVLPCFYTVTTAKKLWSLFSYHLTGENSDFIPHFPCSKRSCWSTVFVAPQSSTTVAVSNENAPAAAPLVVKGYDVSGEVQSDGEPMKGVSFLLYSASVTQKVKGLLDSKPNGIWMSFHNMIMSSSLIIYRPINSVWTNVLFIQDISGCSVAPVDGAVVGDASLVYLCSSQSREDGTFSFPCLPSGEYTVVRSCFCD